VLHDHRGAATRQEMDRPVREGMFLVAAGARRLGARAPATREFCELLRTPERRVWLDWLIAYCLETGRGKKLDRLADAITAMGPPSAFLDDVTGGSQSVRSRLAAEGSPYCRPPETRLNGCPAPAMLRAFSRQPQRTDRAGDQGSPPRDAVPVTYNLAAP
jgi:hypothetical protein